jgi:hypothetical protein
MILSAATVVLALAFAPAALAQSSSVDTYGGQGGEVAGLVSSGDSGSPGSPSGDGTASSSSALPFTGLDVTLLAGGGLVLLLAGIGMARLVGRTEDSTA